MGVVMKGGTSGTKDNYLAPVPSAGQSQPVLDTSGSSMATDLNLSQCSGNDQDATPKMPTSGTIPESSTDVHDQDAPGSQGSPWNKGTTK